MILLAIIFVPTGLYFTILCFNFMEDGGWKFPEDSYGGLSFLVVFVTGVLMILLECNMEKNEI